MRLGRRSGGSCLGVAIACAVALAPSSAGAQTSVDEAELRRRQREEDVARREKDSAPSVRSGRPLVDADADDLPTETPCFPIQHLELDGAERGFGWARRYVRRYEGRCIGQQGVNVVVRRLTQRILARGKVTTRVGIPEQDLSSGTLRLVLVVGTLRRVTYADDAGSKTRWQTALPIRAGDTLDVRDLDQALEQLKRVPSQDVELAIRPGEEPGQSDLELRVKRARPWRASATVDDGGAKSTGKLQATLTAALDDPLTLNDLLSVVAQHDADFQANDHQSWGLNGNYSVPYGYWTFGVSGGSSRYRQVVAGGQEAFTYRGQNTNLALHLERVVRRDQVSKSLVSLELAKRWGRTWINDVEIEVQRREVTSAALSVSHRHTIGRATVQGELEVRRGLPWWAQRDPSEIAPGAGSTQFTIGTLDLNVSVPFRLLDLPLRYRNQTRYQYTGDRLLVADQLAIGGRYTVRGLDGEQTLAAERGWYTRNDLGVTVPRIKQELYVAADYGRVAGPSSAPLPGIILAGAAVGVRGGWRMLSWDGFIGWPLAKPERMNAAATTLGFMVTAQY